ncbi:MAG TPA: hypothetical protein VIM16_15415 [Mucilaginibacter sp.]|jgi:hypothetical protein
MAINKELEQKREQEIEHLITNPISTDNFEALFTRKRRAHGGDVKFKLKSSEDEHVGKQWGSKIKDNKVIFSLDDINVPIGEEYLIFREKAEELVFY